jgi:hypothetical protein
MKVSIGNVRLPVKSNASTNSSGLHGLHMAGAAPRNTAIPESSTDATGRAGLSLANCGGKISMKASYHIGPIKRSRCGGRIRDPLNITPRQLPKR